MGRKKNHSEGRTLASGRDQDGYRKAQKRDVVSMVFPGLA
jgi:hypothetical protein